jgi:drug/metabolite transporter (DMT)-like permease
MVAYIPHAMLLVLGVLWGAGFSLAKIAGEAAIPPFAYTFWQAAASGTVLTAIAWWRAKPPPLDRASLVYYLIAGLTASALPMANTAHTVPHLPAGVMAVVTTFSPILTYALALAFGLERAVIRKVTGIAIGFAGAMLMVVPRAALPSPDMAVWVLAGMLTPALYAASNLYVSAARPQGVDSLALAAGMQGAAAVAMLVLGLATGQVYAPVGVWGSGDLAMAAHALIQVGSMILMFEVMRLAGPVFLSQVGFLSPISGMVWGMVFFSESHSAWIYAAMAAIFAGLLMVNAPGRRAVSDSRG